MKKFLYIKCGVMVSLSNHLRCLPISFDKLRMTTLVAFIVVVSAVKQSNAQNLDSLWKAYKNTAQPDTNRLNALNKLASIYLYINTDSCRFIAEQELKLAQITHQRKYEGNAFNLIGNAYIFQDNYPEALKNHLYVLKIRQETKDKKGIAASYSNLGLIYYYQGNYPEALKNQFAALKIYEGLNYKKGIADVCVNLGNTYDLQHNYPEALKNYFGALKIYETIKDKKGIAYSFGNIGLIYEHEHNYPEALKNYFAGLRLMEEISDKQGIANSYNNIAGVYDYQGKYTEALSTYFTSLKIKEEIGDIDGIASCYLNLGQLHTKQNQIKEAQNYLNKALQLSKEIGSKDDLKETYADLAVLDSAMGNFKAAFEHHKLYILYRDSLNNEETQKKSLQTGMQYEFDKKEIAVKAEQDKLDAINAEEKKKQQLFLVLVSCILLLVGVFAVFMYNRFRITQKQKIIIEEQKQKVDEAFDLLHEKNKEVMDSIRYAKRIQTALITSEKYISNSLNRLMKNN